MNTPILISDKKVIKYFIDLLKPMLVIKYMDMPIAHIDNEEIYLVFFNNISQTWERMVLGHVEDITIYIYNFEVHFCIGIVDVCRTRLNFYECETRIGVKW